LEIDSDVLKRLTKQGLPLGFRYSFSTPTFQAKPEYCSDSFPVAASPVGAVLEINLSKDILLIDSAMIQDIGFEPGQSPSKDVSVHQRNSCVARKSHTARVSRIMQKTRALHDRYCTHSDVGMSCSTLSHTSFH
jgi:hypothetical protein